MINNYESTISNDLNDVIDKNEILKIIIGIENKNTIDLVRKYMTENIYYTIAHEKVIQIMSKNATKFNGINTVLEENNLKVIHGYREKLISLDKYASCSEISVSLQQR